MPRKHAFSSSAHEPYANDPRVQLKKLPSGPFSFLNPTRAHFHVPAGEVESGRPAHESHLPPGFEFRWRSRDNRKGRHPLVIDPAALPDNVVVPKSTASLEGTLQGIKRMFTEFPVWDVSYLVAQFFTWGSVIFVINGLFYFLPLVAPSTEFPNEGSLGGGITSFLGCIFYQIGVILLMFEAVNENRTGCFGWALEKALHHDDSESGSSGAIKLVPRKHLCFHHHSNKGNIVGKGGASKSGLPVNQQIATLQEEEQVRLTAGAQPKTSERSWTWFPSWHELTTHYFYEVGFIASFILFCSATIFWIVGFASLPPLADGLGRNGRYGVFWTPDILGSVGFVVSSGMLMIETQERWWKPAPELIGWHANFWNTVGSVGFLLSGLFGVISETGPSWCLYQSDLSTTWGSACFLIGSVILWYESLDKYPVEVKKQ